MWAILEKKNMECPSMQDMHDLKNGKYTCSFCPEIPHNEQAKISTKYKICEMKEILHRSRKEMKFKSFESICKVKDKRHGLEAPQVILKMYENEKMILQNYGSGIYGKFIELNTLDQEIWNMCREYEGNSDFIEMYTDESFDQISYQAGIAVVLIGNLSSSRLIISKYINKCESSTRAELIAFYCGVTFMEIFPNIRKLKTDSRASIDSIYKNRKYRAHINEKYRLWLVEIRKKLIKIENIRLEWVKAHSNIEGNELADKAAKKACVSCVSNNALYISAADSQNFHPLSNEFRVEDNPRNYIKNRHKVGRNAKCLEKSKRVAKFTKDFQEMEIQNMMKVLERLKVSFYSNSKKEQIIRFFLKEVADILPSAEKLKLLKLEESNMCSNCSAVETTEHVLTAQCRKEYLEDQIRKYVKNRKLCEKNIMELKEIIQR